MAFPPPGGWGPSPDAIKDGGGYRPSRFHRKHDLGKPIRPVTAYDIFFRNTYPWIKARRPDLTQQQMFSEIGRMWRETTSWEDRQVCYDYSDWEKEKYDREMKGWRKKREEQKEKDRKGGPKEPISLRQDGRIDGQPIRRGQAQQCQML